MQNSSDYKRSLSMLNEEDFHADDLVACYAPPNLRSVMPGNRVMLRSGGPEMIVTRQIDDDIAEVRWGADGEYISLFLLACLTCYGAK